MDSRLGFIKTDRQTDRRKEMDPSLQSILGLLSQFTNTNTQSCEVVIGVLHFYLNTESEFGR
jgi:hypothetical protein